MSVPYSGVRSRSAGIISAIAKQLRTLNLKPINKVTVQFDPFHEKAKETRDFLFHVTTPKIISTNPYCVFKTNVVCDRSEPTITFNFVSGGKILVKSANLSALEILKLCNKHITSLVPIDPEVLKAKEELLEQRRKKKKPRRIKPGSKHRGVEL